MTSTYMTFDSALSYVWCEVNTSMIWCKKWVEVLRALEWNKLSVVNEGATGCICNAEGQGSGLPETLCGIDPVYLYTLCIYPVYTTTDHKLGWTTFLGGPPIQLGQILRLKNRAEEGEEEEEEEEEIIHWVMSGQFLTAAPISEYAISE